MLTNAGSNINTTYSAETVSNPQMCRNGSRLIPMLVFDEASNAHLRTAQESLQDALPGAKPIRGLHSTLAYLSPIAIYDFLHDQVGSNVTEVQVYSEMLSTLTLLQALRARVIGATISPISVGLYGNENIVAIETDEPQSIARLRNTYSLSILHKLGVLGLTTDHKKQFEDSKELKSMTAESKPHISLLKHCKGVDTGSLSIELDIPPLRISDLVLLNSYTYSD